jgi:hypothetical protein
MDEADKVLIMEARLEHILIDEYNNAKTRAEKIAAMLKLRAYPIARDYNLPLEIVVNDIKEKLGPISEIKIDMDDRLEY